MLSPPPHAARVIACPNGGGSQLLMSAGEGLTEGEW
jgi:hypothetical protein